MRTPSENCQRSNNIGEGKRFKLENTDMMNGLNLLYQIKAWPNQGVIRIELSSHESRSVLNHFRTGHGRYADMIYKWRLQDGPEYDDGNERQTSHIIIECWLRRFSLGIECIHAIIPEAIKWIKGLDVNLWW